jgi:hypothetical protein
MKYLKYFEEMNSQELQDSSTQLVPAFNPVTNQRATEKVDKMTPTDILNLWGIKQGETNFADLEDLEKKAIDFFIKNPEHIDEPNFVMPQKTGDGIPRMYGNVGGSSHANSIRVGE